MAGGDHGGAAITIRCGVTQYWYSYMYYTVMASRTRITTAGTLALYMAAVRVVLVLRTRITTARMLAFALLLVPALVIVPSLRLLVLVHLHTQ